MTAPQDPGTAAGWPVPEEAVQAGLDAVPKWRDTEPGWWRDEVRALLAAAAAHIVAATLRRAAERHVAEVKAALIAMHNAGVPDVAFMKGVDHLSHARIFAAMLDRWAQQVQP